MTANSSSVYQQKQSTPTCNRCNSPISWDKKIRQQLNWRGPLNFDDKTKHMCSPSSSPSSINNNNPSQQQTTIGSSAAVNSTHNNQDQHHQQQLVEFLQKILSTLERIESALQQHNDKQ